jgi:hypothetical protein
MQTHHEWVIAHRWRRFAGSNGRPRRYHETLTGLVCIFGFGDRVIFGSQGAKIHAADNEAFGSIQRMDRVSPLHKNTSLLIRGDRRTLYECPVQTTRPHSGYAIETTGRPTGLAPRRWPAEHRYDLTERILRDWAKSTPRVWRSIHPIGPG